MANATPARPGQINGAGNDRAMMLQVFAGEVFTAWAEKNVALNRFYTRTIPHGKSADFPLLGKKDADYHVIGTELTGTPHNSAQQIITVDDMLVSHHTLAEIDEAMLHYDVRRPIAQEMGAALARKFDRNVLQLGCLAARSANPLTEAPGGTQLVAANSNTDGVALAEAILDAVRVLEEKDVPTEDMYAYVRPAQYAALLRDAKDYIDTDLNPEGNGSLASGKIRRIAGIELVKTNNLPKSNITTGVAKYRGNFSTTTALVAGRESVGTVKLIDVTVDAQWDLRRLVWLLVARNAVGHGILRPECAVEVVTAVPS